jgi:hypothetical protein
MRATMICRVCAVENNIPRHKGARIVGICPICKERHALFWTYRPDRVLELSRQQEGG